MKKSNYFSSIHELKEQPRRDIIHVEQGDALMDNELYRAFKYYLMGFWEYFHNQQEESSSLENRQIEDIFRLYMDGKEEYLEAIPEAARRQDPDLFQMLNMTGRGNDLSFSDELQEKYNRKEPALDLAIRLTYHTETLWRAFHIIRDGLYEQLNINELNDLRLNALEMSRFVIPATHVTNSEGGASGIDLHGFIEHSKWDEKESSDYEGNGVYVGIFGSYRNWAEGKIYEFNLALADAFPILVSNDERNAMANVLTEYISVGKEERGEALGTRQWWVSPEQSSNGLNGELLAWQKKLLVDMYGKDLHIKTDDKGFEVVVIDTEDPPIVLATVGKYLDLYRCMSVTSWNLISEDQL